MTLNLEAITSQRIAIGLVENPCCWRLRDEAAKVPADQAIVELGAFKGRSTGWLTLGSQTGNKAPVFSVDPWENGTIPNGYRDKAVTVPQYVQSETKAAYEAHLKLTGCRPFVTTIQATAVDAAEAYDGPPVALLWHDALHRMSDVRDDIKAWLPHLADKAVVICHDVGDSRLGVEAGAKAAMSRRKGFDWDGREINLWAKQATRRGFLVVNKG